MVSTEVLAGTLKLASDGAVICRVKTLVDLLITWLDEIVPWRVSDGAMSLAMARLLTMERATLEWVLGDMPDWFSNTYPP